MKIILCTTLMFIAVKTICNGQANTSLSNLATTVAINQDLLPNGNNTHNLGSVSKTWKVIYVGSSLNFKDTLFLHNKGVRNTFFGSRSGYSLTTGTENAGVGYHSLYSNTTGTRNAALGNNTLYKLTGGSNNSAIGNAALYNTTTGNANTAVGSLAVNANTTGSNNTATGFQALSSNTTGNSNSAYGFKALFSNTTGGYNMALGYQALYLNKSSAYNTGVGNYALYNTNANENTGIGYLALYANTTGHSNTASGAYALESNTTANDNTGMGYLALYINTVGYSNTASGAYALQANTTGNSNTAMGAAALSKNTFGEGNTAVGVKALFNNNYYKEDETTFIPNSYNTGLGFAADISYGTAFNSTVIGCNARVDGPGVVRIGGTNIGTIGGQVGWSSFSDGRYKRNIKQDVLGLLFINKLQPITYTVDIKSLNEHNDKGRKYDSAYEKMKSRMKELDIQAAKTIYNGFIAQEVEKAAEELNYHFSGVDKPKSKDGLYGLRYGDFVVPLVKAVQELSKQNDSLRDELTSVKAQLIDLISKIDQLSNKIHSSSPQLSLANLEQNIPNPSEQSTIIKYYIPTTASAAIIKITGAGGRSIKTYSIPARGNGQLNLQTASFISGTYTYSLMVDGKLVDTKKMVIAR